MECSGQLLACHAKGSDSPSLCIYNLKSVGISSGAHVLKQHLIGKFYVSSRPSDVECSHWNTLLLNIEIMVGFLAPKIYLYTNYVDISFFQRLGANLRQFLSMNYRVSFLLYCLLNQTVCSNKIIHFIPGLTLITIIYCMRSVTG